jgi:hypothetical protein
LQFTRVNSDPDETDGLLGVIDKVGLKGGQWTLNNNIKNQKARCNPWLSEVG